MPLFCPDTLAPEPDETYDNFTLEEFVGEYVCDRFRQRAIREMNREEETDDYEDDGDTTCINHPDAQVEWQPAERWWANEMQRLIDAGWFVCDRDQRHQRPWDPMVFGSLDSLTEHIGQDHDPDDIDDLDPLAERRNFFARFPADVQLQNGQTLMFDPQTMTYRPHRPAPTTLHEALTDG